MIETDVECVLGNEADVVAEIDPVSDTSKESDDD